MAFISHCSVHKREDKIEQDPAPQAQNEEMKSEGAFVFRPHSVCSMNKIFNIIFLHQENRMTEVMAVVDGSGAFGRGERGERETDGSYRGSPRVIAV